MNLQFRIQGELEALMEQVKRATSGILRSSGLDKELTTTPALMLADWSTQGLRYAGPEWLDGLPTFGSQIGLHERGPSFAKRRGLNNEDADVLITRLLRRYAEEKTQRENRWMRLALASGRDIPGAAEEMLRALVVDSPREALRGWAKTCLGLVIQPIEDGYAGHCLRKQQAVMMRVDDPDSPVWPPDLAAERETDSLDYEFMQFLETTYFGIHHVSIVVSPISEGPVHLGVLILFLFSDNGSVPIELHREIWSKVPHWTIDSQLSLSVMRALAGGMGELVADSALSAAPHQGSFATRDHRLRVATEKLLSFVVRVLPCMFCGVLFRDPERRWRLDSLVEYEYTPDPRISDPSRVNQPAPGWVEFSRSFAKWELASWRIDEANLRTLTLTSEDGLELPLDLGTDDFWRRSESLERFARLGFDSAGQNACVIHRLDPDRVMFLCLPRRTTAVENRLADISTMIELAHQPTNLGTYYYQRGRQQVMKTLDHEASPCFFKLPDYLTRIRGVLQRPEHKGLSTALLDGFHAHEQASPTLDYGLVVSIGAAEYARSMLAAVTWLTNMDRQLHAPSIAESHRPLREILDDAVKYSYDRLVAKAQGRGIQQWDWPKVRIKMEGVDPSTLLPSVPLRMVMENLLANARQAHDSPGPVVVVARPEPNGPGILLSVINKGSLEQSSRGIGHYIIDEICERLAWRLQDNTNDPSQDGQVVYHLTVPPREAKEAQQ
jgi:signal transduction histidine kinase